MWVEREDESRESGCHEPGIAVCFARRAKNSLNSGSLRREHGRVTYSEKIVSLAVIKVTSPYTWQEDGTAK